MLPLFIRIGFIGVVVGVVIAAVILWSVTTREAAEIRLEKRQFVGSWEARSDYLRISSSGRVDLEINGPSRTLSISNGMIASFSHGEICVGGFWPFEPDCLAISEAPYVVDGDLAAIQVDGVELRRRQTSQGDTAADDGSGDCNQPLVGARTNGFPADTDIASDTRFKVVDRHLDTAE